MFYQNWKNEYPNDYEILFCNNVNITVRNYNMIKLKYFSEQEKINFFLSNSATIPFSSINDDVETDDIYITP